MYNAIIVGSGPAGTSAAYGLRGKGALMLDVGFTPSPCETLVGGNIHDLRRTRQDLFHELIGEQFQALHNLYHEKQISLKLKAPFMSYIVKDWEKLSPLVSDSFEPMISFARGGLANAWGAGVYRFVGSDLAGFPISSAELEPYYDELTKLIGISGKSDDLDQYFGKTDGLLEPLELSRFAKDFLGTYGRNKAHFTRHGVSIGAPRLAVLSREYAGRPRYAYENLEFFKPYIASIYNPVFTLAELIEKGEVDYAGGYLVEWYKESENGVEVAARNLRSGELESFSAKRLILAAGALNTAKIALRAGREPGRELPILDNPMSCVPLFRLKHIGAQRDPYDGSLGQLNVIYDSGPQHGLIQGTLYGTSGPLRSDVIFDFPLSIKANISFAKYLSPAMGLLMLFYPGRHMDGNHLRLDNAGRLEVRYNTQNLCPVEEELIRIFRKVGFLGHKALCMYPKIGNSLHYAGMLPMREHPGPFETDRLGRLDGSREVYVVDGACFPELPAKNLTFTIMANSLRIAAELRKKCQ